MEELPTIKFGKYKGNSVLDLLADENYVEWLKQQPWFANHKQIYNIVVNQTISTTNNSKTPEHNKLQNYFLDKINQEKLLLALKKYTNIDRFEKINNSIDELNKLFRDDNFIRCFGEHTFPKCFINLDKVKVIFEDKYNWDLVMVYDDYQELFSFSNLDTEISDRKNYYNENNLFDSFNSFCRYIEYRKEYYKKIIQNHIDIFNSLNIKMYLYHSRSDCDSKEDENLYEIKIKIYEMDYAICCELKPTLGDDYPTVLRKLKTQIELTINHKTVGYNKGKPSFEGKKKMFVLIIGTFTSIHTTKEQLIEIFAQSNIKVLFTDEIFKASTIKCIDSNYEKVLDQDNLIGKNEFLTQQLLQAEEKIKQLQERNMKLEEEIQSLQLSKKPFKKSNSGNKTINDYF